jgi:hypothetical protein
MGLISAMKNVVEQVVYLFVLIHPKMSADQIYESWSNDKSLLEYDRPTLSQLRVWLYDIRDELLDSKPNINI